MVSFDAVINKIYAVYFRLTSTDVPADFRTYLSNMLNAGTPLDQVLSNVFRAPTVQLETIQIMRLYRAAFGRSADSAGLDLWAGILRGIQNQNTIYFMETYWANTPEYLARFPSTMSTIFFVQKLYTDLLGRNGDPAEVTNVVNSIDSGQWTRPGTLARFAGSPEFIGRYEASLERSLKEAFYDVPNAYARAVVDHDVVA